MKRFLQWILVTVMLLAIIPANAQQTAETFVQETRYLLYLPQQYAIDSTQRWPLLVFLHGSGESGTDLEKVKVHGPPKLIAQGRQLPFIVVSPQATNGWKTDQLMGMINDIKKKYKVDNERVYLTGLSMGGFGTWNLATEFPEEFAAIAPICGGGDSSKAWVLRHMPVWCFHGAKDNVVPLSASQQMMDALKPYNPGARFTVYPEANHDSWTETYDNDSLFRWLLAQKKFRHREVAANKPLTEYGGIFLSPEKDTFVVKISNDSLFLNTPRGRNRILFLRPSDTDMFFFNAAAMEEIVFHRDAKNKIDGFVYMGRERQRFRKVFHVKLLQTTKNKKH